MIAHAFRHHRSQHHRGRWIDRIVFDWAAVLLPLTILLGGGTAGGLNADILLELLSLPLLHLAIYRIWEEGGLRAWRGALVVLIGTMLLPLLQLVPLPPSIWAAFPGRAGVADIFVATGIEARWRPLSLTPHATLLSFFSILPAASLFLATLSCDTRQRYALLPGVMSLAIVSVLFGLLQYTVGHQDNLTLFAFSHVGDAVGFFANRNHFAALIYMSLPIAVAWTLMQSRHEHQHRRAAVLFGIACIVVLLLGLSVAVSRAGATLGVAAAFGSLLLFWQSRPTSRLTMVLVVAAGLALFLFAILLQLGLIDLLTQRTVEDIGRAQAFETTLQALERYGLFGSGFGTFVPIFMMFETPQDLIGPYVNHAHNEWLEVPLEGGLIAIVLLALFGSWLLQRLWVIWHRRSAAMNPDGLLLARGAGLTIVLVLAHSWLDYPLRTTALMSVFAICCAFLLPPK